MSREEFRKKSDLQIFLSYFRPYRGLFLLDMAAALSIALIDLAFPFVSRWCLYELLPKSAFSAFWAVMGLMLLAYFLRAGFTYIICYWGHNFGIRVETDIRRDLFRHMQELSYSYYDETRVGLLLSRLTSDLFDITEFAHHAPEDIFVSSVTILGALIIMFTIQWRLALVLAVMLPLLLCLVYRSRFSMRNTARAVKKTTASINADFESELSGIRTAKAFANEEKAMASFEEANRSFRSAKVSFHRAMAGFHASLEFSLSVLSLSVIAAGGALIMQGKLTVIDLITFSLYVSAFVNPIRKLATTAELVANGTAGLHRFSELMRTEPALSDAEDAEEMHTVRGEICFDKVSFAYREEQEVLKEISVRIPVGETFALVGSSGGGKTTFSQLIPRFYDVTGGAVRIDGQDVRKVTQHSLHRNIGVVQQDVFLFADTVAENIRYGRLDATRAEIIEAAKRAEIYEDIMAMPEGFETNVGERGVLLSGGQKQRISIARIFLKNPPVLILDEATSALDTVTEARIQKAFEELSRGRTTIVIAHRLATVKNADRIAVIEKGRLAAIGSHEELMLQDGEYAALIRSQQLK